MIKYLLDTNVLSEPLRPQPNPELMRRLKLTEGECALSVISWHELLFGVCRLPEGRRKARLMAYLYDVIHPSLPMLPYDEAAAARHALIRQARATQGRPLPFADGQIASIALTHGLTLVTANTKDFIGVEGLSLEDWLAAQ